MIARVPSAVSADSSTDSTITARTYQHVRGLEREPGQPGHGIRQTLHYLFLVPRVATDIVLTGAGFSAVLIDEKKVIKKFEDFFYIYQNKLAWFPILSYASGFSQGFGLQLFYREEYFSATLKAAYGGQENWRTRLSLSHTFFLRHYLWKSHFSVQMRSSDDLRFYGIGSRPRQDSRSFFRPDSDQDYGIYRQQRLTLEFTQGLIPAGDWQINYSLLYGLRKLGLPSADNSQRLDRVFDIANLPGYNLRSGHWYQELAVLYDNRANLKQTTEGYRVEAFAAQKVGTLNDSGHLLLAGFDATAFINIIHDNRFLIPRVVFTTMEQTDNDFSTFFVDYPQHPAFRGISSKALLRNDNISLLNSLEYQWPLTYHLQAILFYDQILVGPSLRKISLRGAPYVVGFGLEAHNPYSELARLFIGYGSQSIVVKAQVGFSSRYKDRTDWR